MCRFQPGGKESTVRQLTAHRKLIGHQQNLTVNWESAFKALWLKMKNALCSNVTLKVFVAAHPSLFTQTVFFYYYYFFAAIWHSFITGDSHNQAGSHLWLAFLLMGQVLKGWKTNIRLGLRRLFNLLSELPVEVLTPSFNNDRPLFL